MVGAAFREEDGTPRLASLAVHPSGALDPSFKATLHGSEQQIFTAGSHPGILEIDGWKIALAICLDAARPGHAEWAAAAGADVYAVSALYTAGEDHRLGLHLGGRAMDNRMFSVLANLPAPRRWGPPADSAASGVRAAFRSGRPRERALRC